MGKNLSKVEQENCLKKGSDFMELKTAGLFFHQCFLYRENPFKIRQLNSFPLPVDNDVSQQSRKLAK